MAYLSYVYICNYSVFSNRRNFYLPKLLVEYKMKKFLLNCIAFLLLLFLVSSILWIYTKNIKKNSYLLARIDKHEILKKTPSPKVIFVGGSNLAFGIDCSQIEDTLGITCVNMGLHAGQGMHFIMDDFDPFIKNMSKTEGNIIVVMPEFAHFFGTTSEGGGTTLAEVFLTDPLSIEIMSFEQIIKTFKGIPKLMTGSLMESFYVPSSASNFKYLRSNFDDEGDEIGHLKLAYDNTRTPIPPHIYINGDINDDFCIAFKNKIREWENHATVVFFPETVYSGYIEDNKDKLRLLEEVLKTLQIPYHTNIDEFSYSYDKVFKAPDHITGKGVRENSGRIGHILKNIIAKY